LKGKNELGRWKDFHCTPVLVYLLPSSYLQSHCLFALNWHFWWGNGVKRAKNDPVLVLNAKGGEIKAKANGSANHLWILKKGEFLALDQFFSGNISRFAQTSVFDLEIGKRIWFAKTNQVVAKSDPNMPNHKQKLTWSSIALMLHSFCCFLMCWRKSPKRGRLKGKCALGPFL
jgi:hypothetical protein